MIEWALMLGVGLNDRYAEEVTRFQSKFECEEAALVISREVTREELLDKNINVIDPRGITPEQIMAMESAIDARCIIASPKP